MCSMDSAEAEWSQSQRRGYVEDGNLVMGIMSFFQARELEFANAISLIFNFVAKSSV